MGCGECVTVCPTAAIEMKPQESQSEQQAAFDYCVENIDVYKRQALGAVVALAGILKAVPGRGTDQHLQLGGFLAGGDVYKRQFLNCCSSP